MSPVIESSIFKIGHERWAMGSLMICEKLSDEPQNSIASWDDAHGSVYILRKRTAEDGTISAGTEEDSESHRIHHAGTSAAVWNFGNAFCKVKSWTPEVELESNIIRYVKRQSPIPVPEVIYTWIDHDWNRSFLILKRVEGTTLQKAWTSLSTTQRQTIAGEVARFCAVLTATTSAKLESISGGGVPEPFLSSPNIPSEPSWKPWFLGPFTPAEIQSYLSGLSNAADPLGIGEVFHLYHADLGPTNIMVSEDGEVISILDWESAAFYPRFWIATKPYVSAGFVLQGDQARKWDWSDMLVEALGREGFALQRELYSAWSARLPKCED